VVETSRALATGSAAALDAGGFSVDVVHDDALDASAVVGRLTSLSG